MTRMARTVSRVRQTFLRGAGSERGVEDWVDIFIILDSY
jgi:hypothetical protein